MIYAEISVTSDTPLRAECDPDGRTLNHMFHDFRDITGRLFDESGASFTLDGTYRLMEVQRHHPPSSYVHGEWTYKLVRVYTP